MANAKFSEILLSGCESLGKEHLVSLLCKKGKSAKLVNPTPCSTSKSA